MAAAMLTACGTTDTADTADTAATESDWQYISDKGEMIIGITLFAPMNYKEGDRLVGFETEFAAAVCEKLGVNPKFQEIDWGQTRFQAQTQRILTVSGTV